ncbi:MAG: AMP-binding protein, partial [Angelakisella sp.]
WGCIYGQWIGGTAMLGYDADNKFNPRNLIDVIAKHRPTTICVPGTIYRFMMREGLTHEEFASVHHCCTAGEPLSPEVVNQFYELTGLTIHEGYGQSESSVLVGNYGWFPPRAGSMGKPAPIYDIVLLDDDGNVCKAGEEGELVIRGLDKGFPIGLFHGYFREGSLVPAYDENYIYHTGDICWTDEEGYFWFVGRNDDMIKCSAYRIGPFEIESVLMTHPAVHECAITGAPDPIRGQVVKATIVLEAGYVPSPELTKDLQNHVKHLTAPYKYPRVVEYIDALPKTTSGKIIRRMVR